MAPEESWTRTGLQLPRLGETLRLFWRAVRLRCPHCGDKHTLVHWFKLRERCPVCGLRFERGEHDYFTGSMLFNYIFVGLLVVGGMAVAVIVSWPHIPWTLLEWLAPVLAVVGIVGLFPYSKLLWLAFDLMLRPVTPTELQWHRGAKHEWSTDDTSDSPPAR